MERASLGLRERDEHLQQIARFIGPFPDVRITDTATIVDGNIAVVRFTVTGTHQGDLEGPDGPIHATGRSIHVDGVEVFPFDKALKLIDLLTVEDLASLMKQIKGH